MRIFRHFDAIPQECRGVSIALGNFDGFHRGHQKVLTAAARAADELTAPLAVFTTEPHPRQFFNPDLPPFLLTPFRPKAHYMEQFGVDIFFVANFNSEMASLTAEEFVGNLLIERFGARHVTVGYDYRFGKGRGGDTTLLRRMAAELNFRVSVIEPVTHENEVYSSTLIREYLRDGQPEKAAELMGHWWSVEGHVLKGDRRGGEIGFPTANLSPDEYLIPAFGVYAVRAAIEEGPHAGSYEGVANVGRRPTFDKSDIVLEVHLFDFDGIIYGNHMKVELLSYLRPERKFDGIEDLSAQIAKDSEEAKRRLARPEFAAERFAPIRRPGK